MRIQTLELDYHRPHVLFLQHRSLFQNNIFCHLVSRHKGFRLSTQLAVISIAATFADFFFNSFDQSEHHLSLFLQDVQRSYFEISTATNVHLF